MPRVSEWLLIGYFCYAAVLAVLLPGRSAAPAATLAVNAAVIGGIFLLAFAHSLRRREFLGVLRDWYPMPLILLGYREMGWLAPPHHTYRFESAWVVWDRMLLDGWGLKAAIESFGPLLPSVLEISYTLVYTTAPGALAVLYAYRHRERSEPLLRILLLGTLIAYALFPWFPSEPPRTVFPGELFPSMNTIFRQLNWRMLSGYGIHTSVFPSAHVSGAFSAAFGLVWLLPERRWAGRLMLALAATIATATVYGRYHYLADAAAGFGVSVLAYALSKAIHRCERRVEKQPSAVA